MFSISREQFKVLSSTMCDDFEDWMLVHLTKHFPICRRTPEPPLRDFIQYGIQRAASYNIRSRRDVCKYIDLMVVFGRDYDMDSRVPWAASILGRTWSAATRMRLLMEAAQRQLKRA